LKRLIWYMLIATAWLPDASCAQVIDLLVDPAQRIYIKQFMSSQLQADVHLQLLDVNDEPNQQSQWLIAMGDQHLAWASRYQHHYRHVLLFHVSVDALRGQPAIDNSYALLLDQPLNRQIALVGLLFPRAENLAIVTTQIEQTDDSVSRIVLETGAHWQQALSNAMLSYDVLLIPHQPRFYQPSVAHALLLTAYRQRKAVIGPDENYVAAGAIASCYTRFGQYLDQLIDMVNALQDQDPLPRTQYPRLFQVAVNRPVARSLGLNPAPDAELARQLRAVLENSP
jgi:hypothetical protein